MCDIDGKFNFYEGEEGSSDIVVGMVNNFFFRIYIINYDIKDFVRYFN